MDDVLGSQYLSITYNRFRITVKMRPLSGSNTLKKKLHSSSTSTTNSLPAKKPSLIYKSIYMNILQNTKADLPESRVSKQKTSNDKEHTEKILKAQQSMENKRMKPQGSSNNQGLMQPPSILFSKPGSKNNLCNNYMLVPSIELEESTKAIVSKNTFIYHYIIGKGGFGKVWKVESKKNRQFYALKQMLKSLVMTKKSVQSVMNERMLLADLSHPFVVNMHYAFQDRQTLFLVMDLMPGGDLRYHIGTNKKFTEVQAKFFIACIVLGLEYLHKSNIIHRDLKPQNLVLDTKGYLRITDLGIARVYRANNSSDTSGTPGYMSPEVLCRLNHEFVSDFFGLGVIAYQLMFGKVPLQIKQRPYNGKTRKQIRDQILAKQVQIRRSEVPDRWSYQAADFINRLIQRKPQNRLGFNGIEQLKQHPWLKQLAWKKILNKQLESPFVPTMQKDDFDQDQQITIDDEQQASQIQKNALLLRKPAYQQKFNGYYYDKSSNSLAGLKVETEPCSTNQMSFQNPSFSDLDPPIRRSGKQWSQSYCVSKDVTPPQKHSNDGHNIKINDLLNANIHQRRESNK